MKELHTIVGRYSEAACGAENHPSEVAKRIIALLEGETRDQLTAEQKAQFIGNIRDTITLATAPQP